MNQQRHADPLLMVASTGVTLVSLTQRLNGGADSLAGSELGGATPVGKAPLHSAGSMLVGEIAVIKAGVKRAGR